MTGHSRHSADDWPRDDDPMVDLLRGAMHRQVDGYYPAGDGLQRIQSRVARRQRWMVFRPVFAAVALASVVALVAIGVSLVPGSKSPHTTLADDDRTSATTSSSGANGVGEPGADGPLLMMWPYQNAEQAAANGTGAEGLPDLTDPVATTQSFVDTMFPGAGLIAGAPAAKGGMVGVPIQSPSGQVGLAQLQPVPAEDDTLFVVASVTTAPNNGLVVDPVSKPENGTVEVKGTVGTTVRQASTAVNVALYAGGQTPTAQSDADLPASGSRTWSTQLAVPESVTGGYVLAWSADATGAPTAIAAIPIGSGRSSSPAPSETSSASGSGTETGPTAPPTGTGSTAQPSTPAPQGSTTSPSTSPTESAPPTTAPSPSNPTTPSTTAPPTASPQPSESAPPTYSADSDPSPPQPDDQVPPAGT